MVGFKESYGQDSVTFTIILPIKLYHKCGYISMTKHRKTPVYKDFLMNTTKKRAMQNRSFSMPAIHCQNSLSLYKDSVKFGSYHIFIAPILSISLCSSFTILSDTNFCASLLLNIFSASSKAMLTQVFTS